jgi:hypothetical protein
MTSLSPATRTAPSRPALITGTSSEFLGRRALPTILSERPIAFILGPAGVGKSSVAARIADAAGATIERLDTRGLQDALVERVAARRWEARWVEADALILDGPVWLKNRPAAVAAVCELLRLRSETRRRTVVCQSESDGSVEALMDAMECGSLAVVGLRFPKGSRGRLRFARRICDDLGLARAAAKGTDLIEPWGYAEVIAQLRALRTGDASASP